jgi:signal transduction histidine kinase/ActR/RegA family two-component response regulator
MPRLPVLRPGRPEDGVQTISEKLVRERRARLAAERLLDQKKTELLAAHQKLSQHALSLSEQVVAQRGVLVRAESEAADLRGAHTRALTDLDRANAVAETAERRLWAALDTFREGFALFDRDLRLVVANRAYVGAFRGLVELGPGTSYDTLLRQVAATGLVELDGADWHDWLHEMTARIMAERIAPKVIVLKPDRHVKLIDRRSPDGDLVSLAIDISDTIRREAELEEARETAEAANRAKSAFLANMTHELRTPINGMVGMAELLAESVTDDEQRLYAETIRSSGDALLTIINDVLDFSKAEAERLKLFPEPFDLERCIHEVLLLLQPAARDKGLQLLVDFDIFLPTRFVADPGRIRQILTNLIGNAVKFTPKGHVIVRVVGFDAPEGQYDLRIAVEDTGIGIAPDQIERIFGEFTQVEDQANRKFEGTGLGLAITKRLIDLMGGTIWVDSVPGEGSSFGFSLTLKSVPGDPDRLDRPITLTSALVIAPPKIDRALLLHQLQAIGIAPRHAAGLGDLARVDHGAAAPGVVLIDDTVADGDPDRALAAVRALWPDVPVILLAASAAMAASAGVAARMMVLGKPLMRSQLHRMLQDLSKADAPRTTGQSTAATDVPAPDQPRRMRVLAAEDNKTNQLVFRKMLKDCDIDIRMANNGREAVEMYRAERPDLIFMDISMPEMDGREATRAIREIEAKGHGGRVPIIALTAHAMAGDEVSILAAGMDHYMTKPLRKADIVGRVVEFCPEEVRPAVPDEALPAGSEAPI